ncbi:MAG: lysyl oxidase family protein [Bacteroidia bacterium]
MKKLYLAFIATCISSIALAQCPTGQSEVAINIIPDDYPQEISWELTSDGEVLASGGSTGTTLCVTAQTCMVFTIFDSAGDGICCQYGQGSYTVTLDGTVVASGGNYTTQQSTLFNCPPGQDCNSSIPIDAGQYTAPNRDTWYRFTPDSSGMYFISTCGMNACDTKLWVYDHCQGIVVGSGNEGTIYYDDNAGGCDQQARINALMEAGSTYYIRVGDSNESCEGEINWSLFYNGPIQGCMDPVACNYNPVATVPDVCYFTGDPNCPEGRPDLIVVENTIKTSIYLTSINASNCQVVEGCLTGYGQRDIIRFTTHIKNIGTADYYIGSPNSQPSQFSWGNCHGHWHYEGYAEYIMYDETGYAIPVGFKNGFCVLDLECGDGGTAQFGCSNMGISRQCGDIYSSGLDCQWMDITDLDTGRYTMVVRVNWDNSPDALGHIELSHTNNWAQVCVYLGMNDQGEKTIQVLTDCPTYVDCAGDVYGPAVLDCEGTCGGTRIMGDLNASGSQEMNDAHLYVQEILGNDIWPTPCNDINQDDRITVFDAALVSSCVNFGSNHPHVGNVPHNHCHFPGGLMNVEDTVTLSIMNVDFSEKFIDIGILNPDTRVNSYEFDLDGVKIWNVESLIDETEYPIQPEFLIGGSKVIGISYPDSMIRKYYEPTPLVRVHYYELTTDTVCITRIVDIVNANIEQTITEVGGDCWVLDVTGMKNFDKANFMSLMPNPAASEVNVALHMQKPTDVSVSVFNAQGSLIRQDIIAQASEQTLQLNTADWANGIYLVNLVSEKGVITKKLIIQH